MSAERKLDLKFTEAGNWVVFEKRFDDRTFTAMTKWLEDEETGVHGYYDYWVSMGMWNTSETCFVFTDVATAVLFKLRFG